MRKIVLIMLVIIFLTGCNSKNEVVSANENSSQKQSVEVVEQLVFEVASGEMTYNYITKIDNNNNIFKNTFVFETDNSDTNVIKYTLLENNSIRNFIKLNTDDNWYETNDEFRTDYFLCEDHIEGIKKDNDNYIVSISPNLLSRFLRAVETNAPFDYDYLSSLKEYEIVLTIEDNLVKTIKVDLLDIINTTKNEDMINYDKAHLSISYNYDDFELVLPDEILGMIE